MNIEKIDDDQKKEDDNTNKRQKKEQNLFTTEEDEQLIRFVRQNKCLYDINHRFYRHKSYKVQLWTKIGLELDRTHEECYKRWVYIRDYYVRKRRQPAQHGSAEPIRRRAELLSFIDNSMPSKQQGIIKHETENQQRIDDVTTESTDDGNGSPEYSNGPVFFNCDEQTQFTTENDNTQQNFGFPPHAGVNDNLSWYENREDLTRDSSYNHHSRELDLIQQVLAITNKEQDDIDLFFASIVQTVKRLSPDVRAELKLEIANLVGRAELKFLRSQE